ncbi:MAG TPA: hypothetical protein PKA10_18215 [Selenomonadales bacterium]|nr:hypothetical protein [Selenomonadales bacterium]
MKDNEALGALVMAVAVVMTCFMAIMLKFVVTFGTTVVVLVVALVTFAVSR